MNKTSKACQKTKTISMCIDEIGDYNDTNNQVVEQYMLSPKEMRQTNVS